MKRKSLTTLMAITIPLLVAGCATTQEPGRPGAPPRVVQVTNYNPLRVTVDAVASGSDYRLGDVETNATETFRLPEAARDFEFRILVDPIGSTETFLSHPVSSFSSDVVEVTVQADLDLTSVVPR